MTVKQCAEQFKVSVPLIREMLRLGLVTGEKVSGVWSLDERSVEGLSQFLSSLREKISSSDGELPAGCWDWLYEEELPVVAIRQPWEPASAPPDVEWPVLPLFHDRPTPQIPTSLRPSSRPRGSAQTRPPSRPNGPPCPVCQQDTYVRIMDAAAPDWYNYCENCREWVLPPGSTEERADSGYRIHTADLDLPTSLPQEL